MTPIPALAAGACLALLGLGCVPPDDEQNQGIAVGNPGVVALSLAAAEGFVWTAADASVSALGFASCGSGDTLRDVAGTLDLRDGPALLPFPAGSWCGLLVRFDGPLTIAASWSEAGASGTLTATLTVPEVTLGALAGTLAVDAGTAWALELASPDWLDAGALGLTDGVDLVVTEESPEHATLVAALTDETALFDDGDGSGLIEAPERDAGPAALPMELAFNLEPVAGVSSDASGGAGCALAPAPTGPLGILLLLVSGSLVSRRSTGRRRVRRPDRRRGTPAAT